jgi:hypothetical protein
MEEVHLNVWRLVQGQRIRRKLGGVDDNLAARNLLDRGVQALEDPNVLTKVTVK